MHQSQLRKREMLPITRVDESVMEWPIRCLLEANFEAQKQCNPWGGEQTKKAHTHTVQCQVFPLCWMCSFPSTYMHQLAWAKPPVLRAKWLKMGVMISTRSKWNMVKTGPGGGLPLPEGTCRKPTASTLRLWNLQSLLFVQLIWAPQLSSLKITWICLCLWGLRYSAWLR